MDIPKLSMDMADARLMQSVSVGVLKRAMDQMKLTGEQLVEMIEETKNLTDSQIDIKI